MSYSPTKAKFYLVNPSAPAKAKKTHGRITPDQEINWFKFPTLPRQHLNSPLSGHDA